MVFGGGPACAEAIVQRSQWGAMRRPGRQDVDDERLGQQVRLEFEVPVVDPWASPPMLIGGDGAAAIDRTVARGGGVVGGNVDVDAAIERGWTVREGFEPPHTGRW